MKITKKTFLSFNIILLFCLIQVLGVFSFSQIAQASLWDDQIGMGTDAGEVGRGFNPLNYGGDPTDPRVVVGNVISIFLGILGMVFLVLIIIAGLKWMTAEGNENQVGEAKTQIGNAVIGLVIIILSYSITQFVMANLYSATNNN